MRCVAASAVKLNHTSSSPVPKQVVATLEAVAPETVPGVTSEQS